MHSGRKACSILLSVILVFGVILVPHAYAADDTETLYYVEDLGDGVIVETTVTIYPSLARDSTKRAMASSNYSRSGSWIATVTLETVFKYNGITAGVVSTDYAKLLASGWSYNNHKITTTNLSTSSGATATLSATLKKLLVNVPITISLHCDPYGNITTN